jgi:signal transduction histidine kinase
MWERAQILGGALHIESVPGAGTKLRVEVPIPGDENGIVI